MFKTERCSLSTFQESDCEDVSKLFTNRQVRKYLGGIRDADSLKETLEDMLDPHSGSYFWVVRGKSTKEFIGLISLDPHHDGIDYEISYQLLPDWWGRGYAAETAAVIIDFALNSLKLPAVVAETQSANISSCRLLKKLGMELERKFFRYGAEQRLYVIRCLKSEGIQGLSNTFIE
ncbi:GNAT family N-acetyltransferase [Planococcus halotolerans]|uniref:GNAT family N-acetyltransferase n=1 Tax=Planococcus halotolerans TaxID=2233542 RepID=UPI001091AB12|nr:GNAT family N-acetyltransferase [Planococcus halotolerans]QHJ69928.1 GNAT family N-acetyltransferase [Planococcus halotolerans]